MKRITIVLAVLSSACSTVSADSAPTEPAPTQATARAGTYDLSASEFTAAPAGCRQRDVPIETWTLDMGDPTTGSWSATEHWGEKSSVYTCESEGEGFTCVSEVGFDYGPSGLDADVTLDVRYDGSWDAGSIDGSFELAFTCEGDECSSVAGHWGVNGFPCANAGSFEGTRAGG